MSDNTADIYEDQDKQDVCNAFLRAKGQIDIIETKVERDGLPPFNAQGLYRATSIKSSEILTTTHPTDEQYEEFYEMSGRLGILIQQFHDAQIKRQEAIAKNAPAECLTESTPEYAVK